MATKGSYTLPNINIVDFSVHSNPNDSGTVFVPNSPNNTNLIYRCSITNAIWTWDGTIYTCSALKKYRIVQDLIIGANVITHDLNLSSPFAVTIEVRSSTGSFITVGASTEEANSITINSASAITNARITIVG